MLTVTTEEMSEAEFKASLPKIESILVALGERLKELAQLFSRMSRPQLREVKSRYGRLVGKDRIERLALLGRGLLAEHLALREKCLSAGTLRCLPSPVLGQLNNPEYTHPVLVPGKGVIPKAIKDMSAFELNQILDPYAGKLRTPPEQRKYLVEDFNVVKLKEEQPKDDSEGLRILEAHPVNQDSGKFLVTARNGGQVLILRSDLERWFGLKA